MCSREYSRQLSPKVPFDASYHADSLIDTSSKKVPPLELFSSKGGTLQFQRRDFSVPTEELFSSKGGKLVFQWWKIYYLLPLQR